MEFKEFPKISRYSREVIVTEKIDGTNSCIFIGENGEFLTGSRKRWITPENDNFGFSKWAYDHRDELITIGPGLHFGEWWGNGIQRGYDLTKGERRLSMFNVSRFCLYNEEPKEIPTEDPRIFKKQIVLPKCVGLVPVLWRGVFDDLNVREILDRLSMHGSFAAPGFMKPEGIVVFHIAGNVGFKKTIERDNIPKAKFKEA